MKLNRRLRGVWNWAGQFKFSSLLPPVAGKETDSKRSHDFGGHIWYNCVMTELQTTEKSLRSYVLLVFFRMIVVLAVYTQQGSDIPLSQGVSSWGQLCCHGETLWQVHI
jgi:hypothetical protein